MASATGVGSAPRAGVVLRRLIVIAYLLLLVIVPTSLVVVHTFEGGSPDNLLRALGDESVIIALRLTVIVAFWAVVLNTVFGVVISILLVRYEFPGRRVLFSLIDLPLSVSPVVVGLALVSAYGPVNGAFGPWLEAHGIRIIHDVPGMVMATAFVSMPLVIRELVPVLTEIGTDQEQAARSLGAGTWATFRRITLPSIRWALIYGVVLSLARSLGEFGAVKIVSGNFSNSTQTATLVVEEKYNEIGDPFAQSTAYATAFLLALIAVAALIVVSILRPKEDLRGH